MQSAIRYILILTYGGKPATDVEPDAEKLYDFIGEAKRSCSAFHILAAQRCVISVSGTVKFTEAHIDYDKYGLTIHDRYGNLIDWYTVPEPKS